MIKVTYNNKFYNLEKEKVVYILNFLENGELSELTEKEIRILLRAYGFICEDFLENINAIW